MSIPSAPTKEYSLKNGWKASLVEYFTQEQYDKIQDVLLEGVGYDSATQQQSGTIPASQLRKANDVALSAAVKKLVSPEGAVFEGDSLTIDVIHALPFDPEFPQGELVTIINSLTNPKKKES